MSSCLQLQGSIIMSSLVEVLIGFSGAVGWMTRFVGPLTIVPTIALTGLSLFAVAGSWAGKHWGISTLYAIHRVNENFSKFFKIFNEKTQKCTGILYNSRQKSGINQAINQSIHPILMIYQFFIKIFCLKWIFSLKIYMNSKDWFSKNK